VLQQHFEKRASTIAELDSLRFGELGNPRRQFDLAVLAGAAVGRRDRRTAEAAVRRGPGRDQALDDRPRKSAVAARRDE
jgi:hypothetical protein